jgi:polyisoprenyl-phosphate glycosyltransferase
MMSFNVNSVAKAILIVTPVFDDWESLDYLLSDLDEIANTYYQPLQILVVDDGSTTLPSRFTPRKHLQRVDIISLVRNFGHQRAIAIGLVEAQRYTNCAAVIVMDADGEDQPQHLPLLFQHYHQLPDQIILATRGKRQESLSFRFFYRLYRFLFRLLVGRSINFGNYCLIPSGQLERLTYDSNLWNHLAATITRGRFLIHRIRLDRGTRYDGKSKMNFESLVMHGLSAVSVFVDVVFLRLMLGSAVLALAAFSGILVVIGIVLFTRLAIPGWATNAVGILSVIILQLVIFSSAAIFFILSRRSESTFVPALDTERLIKKRETILSNESAIT